MKRYLFVLISLMLIDTMYAQIKNSNLNDMIATEYSFASYASLSGNGNAFLKFIADDGILFRPNAVNGKESLSNSPMGPGLLSWYPVFAGISRDGDMGFTTGPADFKKDKDSAAIWFGNFATIWQRQSNGEFKFAIDIGNSNNKPTEQYVPLKYETTNLNSSALRKGKNRLKADELINNDKEFSMIISKLGLVQTYLKFTSEESRLLRDEYFPIIETSSISEFLTKNNGVYSFRPTGGKISSSKDIGFTYGELNITNSNENNNGVYSYLHIWKKEGKRWIIVIDVLNKQGPK